MKKLLFITMMLTATLTISAQSNRTVETQKDRYGHVTGTATTTTDSRGNQTTVYKVFKLFDTNVRLFYESHTFAPENIISCV